MSFILLGLGFSGGSDNKEFAFNVGDLGSIPGWGRFPGEVNGYPLTVFLPGAFHEQRSLVCYSAWGLRVGHDWVTFISSVQPLSRTQRFANELQHARPPCPLPTPGVHPNSCSLSQWCHPTILSSVIPFSSRPQSFPESASSQMSQLFASGGQSNCTHLTR